MDNGDVGWGQSEGARTHPSDGIPNEPLRIERDVLESVLNQLNR